VGLGWGAGENYPDYDIFSLSISTRQGGSNSAISPILSFLRRPLQMFPQSITEARANFPNVLY
jgi:hypothetical protein